MLVEHAATCVLVDCGFSVRETERRLARLGRSGDELNAIVVTHEHGDHIDDLQVQPFPVPHHAREPCQFVFGDGERRLGILTDVGCATAHITEQLSGCDALMLECNHEKTLLDNGNYPLSLKRRVAGSQGHLSNAQAETLLRGLETGRLKQVVAAHLSEKHNTPELARAALAAALGCESDWVAVADQDAGLDWREV